MEIRSPVCLPINKTKDEQVSWHLEKNNKEYRDGDQLWQLLKSRHRSADLMGEGVKWWKQLKMESYSSNMDGRRWRKTTSEKSWRCLWPQLSMRWSTATAPFRERWRRWRSSCFQCGAWQDWNVKAFEFMAHRHRSSPVIDASLMHTASNTWHTQLEGGNTIMYMCKWARVWKMCLSHPHYKVAVLCHMHLRVSNKCKKSFMLTFIKANSAAK